MIEPGPPVTVTDLFLERPSAKTSVDAFSALRASCCTAAHSATLPHSPDLGLASPHAQPGCQHCSAGGSERRGRGYRSRHPDPAQRPLAIIASGLFDSPRCRPTAWHMTNRRRPSTSPTRSSAPSSRSPCTAAPPGSGRRHRNSPRPDSSAPTGSRYGTARSGPQISTGAPCSEFRSGRGAPDLSRSRPPAWPASMTSPSPVERTTRSSRPSTPRTRWAHRHRRPSRHPSHRRTPEPHLGGGTRPDPLRAQRRLHHRHRPQPDPGHHRSVPCMRSSSVTSPGAAICEPARRMADSVITTQSAESRTF